MIADVRQLLIDARETLDSAGVTYAVIGGCARNAYAEPRATKDVDFAVSADPTSYKAVMDALSTRGFRVASAVGAEGDIVPDLVLCRDAQGRRIDILFAKTAFERSALARRQTATPYTSVLLPVVSPEDLIVYKLIAGRTQDLADVEKVVAARSAEGLPLDWAYIDHWCVEWGVADRATRARPTPSPA